MYVPATISTLLASEVLLLFSCFVGSAYLVLGVDPEVYLLQDDGLINVGIVVASIVLGMYFQDMYSSLRIPGRTVLAQQICTAIGLAFLTQSILNYASPGTLIPRWLMLTGSIFCLVSLYLLRLSYCSTNLEQRSVLFLGRSPTVQKIAQRIHDYPELGLAVSGYLDEETALEQPQSLGSLADLKTVVNQVKPQQIVVGLAERRHRLPTYELMDLRLSGFPILEVSSMYENTHQRVSVADLRPSDLIFLDRTSDMRLLGQLQSLYSWVLALVGFVATLPLMAIVWLAVKATSPGPALYSQIRSGLYGKPFKLYKFRSMRVDAEAATGAVWASKDDPRITPIGKWLRKLRLDELPQFVNVLRGEMNLVGPRPERPEFVRTLQDQIPFYRQRLFVKPGLTGWAQINHKYGDTIEDTITKLEYDLYYLKHRTIALDFYIMVQTIKVMLLHRGAQ
jgi:exopolysaccharide biosynthesis polyprenyl glycosylphosphotransferase